MYTAENIQQLAMENKLLYELRKILSLKETKLFDVGGKASIKQSEFKKLLESRLSKNDIFITNTEYNDEDDFIIFLKYDKFILIKVKESIINDIDINDYIRDLDACDRLASIYNAIESQCEYIYIPS